MASDAHWLCFAGLSQCSLLAHHANLLSSNFGSRVTWHGGRRYLATTRFVAPGDLFVVPKLQQILQIFLYSHQYKRALRKNKDSKIKRHRSKIDGMLEGYSYWAGPVMIGIVGALFLTVVLVTVFLLFKDQARARHFGILIEQPSETAAEN